jgi:CheY-like chemotaxis protein
MFSSAKESLRSTIPPSDEFTSLEAPLVLPERVFFERLDDLARRIEMLTALLQANGLSRKQGSSVVQAALGAIAANAEEAQVSSLGCLARALQHAVAELVDNATVDPRHVLDILVLDESEISRDFVSLAVETQGHIVRSAKSYDEFIALLGERLPDVVVTEVIHGTTPPRQFCSVLADLLGTRPVQLIIYSALADLEDLKNISGARAVVRKDLGLRALVAELAHLLDKMGETVKTTPP